MQLIPFFVEKPWGGDFISKVFELNSKTKLGEAFIVSTLINSESMINGKSLTSHLGSPLPYLIKIIDASDNLSVQVHPNDEWAAILEKSVGKSECWLVLEAEEGSGIYYGFKEGSSFQDMETLISNNKQACEAMNFVPVQRGDFINVPAGTIHAIGKGIRILEFQQASGITYRIWDWGREGRELHLEKARKVTNPNVNMPSIFKFQNIKQNNQFFIHDDFCLTKTSSSGIKCSSNKSNIAFEIDVNSLKTSMLQV
jgi:mannose-6-phosphate isomerase